MSFWQGQRARLRAMEPGDAAIFYEWNLDGERAHHGIAIALEHRRKGCAGEALSLMLRYYTWR